MSRTQNVKRRQQLFRSFFIDEVRQQNNQRAPFAVRRNEFKRVRIRRLNHLGLDSVQRFECGFDVIAPEAHLPTLSPGDVLAFLDTGAYQDACASNFNGLPRPATVLVRGADAEVVKRAETVDEVFARDTIPARLR